MVDWDKPIQTVNGSPAKVISKRLLGGGIGVLIDTGPCDLILCYDEDGTCPRGGVDIINAPRKRTVWMNCYEDIHLVYSSEAEASRLVSPGLLATIPVTYEY